MKLEVGAFYRVESRLDHEACVIQVVENEGRLLGEIVLNEGNTVKVGQKIGITEYLFRRFIVEEYKEADEITYNPELINLFQHLAVAANNKEWFNELHDIHQGVVLNGGV